MTKQNENLTEQKSNLDQPIVSGNEALRVAVDFAEWLYENNNYRKSGTGEKKWCDWNQYGKIDYFSLEEIYKKYEKKSAKATDR